MKVSAKLTEEKAELELKLAEQQDLQANNQEQDIRTRKLEESLEKSHHQANQLTQHLLEKDNELVELQEQMDALGSE